MRFTIETKLSDLSGTIYQGFYHKHGGGTLVLFRDINGNDDVVVAEFDKNGQCVNASGYRRTRDAWRIFVNIVTADLKQ